MTRRDDLLRTLEGITRTDQFDADARSVLGAKTDAERDLAYQRIATACRYDPETERFAECDGHHRCLCADREDYRAYAELLIRVKAGQV